MESKLREAGIRVLTDRERLKAPGFPYLYVAIAAIKNKAGVYAYSTVQYFYNGGRCWARTSDPLLVRQGMCLYFTIS